MKNTYTHQRTTTQETLEAHTYIDSYSDPEIKKVLHDYKFLPVDLSRIHIEAYRTAKKILVFKTLDICLDTYMSSNTHGLLAYTSPPSTMYIRGEKQHDSMFELIREAGKRLTELVQSIPHTTLYTGSIFRISHTFLKEKRAQHIDGNRKSRLKNLHTRYFVSPLHILYIYYCIHIRHIQYFSYLIIDDVSSTGATLSACKNTLLRTLSLIHRKNPHIRYDVKIFSLSH